MEDAYGFDWPALLDLIEQQPKLVTCHFIESFVLDRIDWFLAFNAPHDTRKVNCSAHLMGHYAVPNQIGLYNRIGSDDELALHELISCRTLKSHRLQAKVQFMRGSRDQY